MLRSALVLGTDYNITTDASTGKPKLTFTNAGTYYYNMDKLLLNESHRRLVNTIYDNNTIKLSDGTKNLTLSSTTIGGKTISNLVDTTTSQALTNKTLEYNKYKSFDKLRCTAGTVTINTDTAPSSNQSLTANSLTTAS